MKKLFIYQGNLDRWKKFLFSHASMKKLYYLWICKCCWSSGKQSWDYRWTWESILVRSLNTTQLERWTNIHVNWQKANGINEQCSMSTVTPNVYYPCNVTTHSIKWFVLFPQQNMCRKFSTEFVQLVACEWHGFCVQNL